MPPDQRICAASGGGTLTCRSLLLATLDGELGLGLVMQCRVRVRVRVKEALRLVTLDGELGLGGGVLSNPHLLTCMTVSSYIHTMTLTFSAKWW